MAIPGPYLAAVAFLAIGFLAAMLYFGGLWWTVSRLPGVRHPNGWYFGSLLIRFALLMAMFIVILRVAGGAAGLASLVGFLAGRLIMVHRIGSARPHLARER